MCVKIVYQDKTAEYNIERPLLEQIMGSKQIIINYEPTDSKIDKFLDEVEKLCEKGTSCHLNIKLAHNNYLSGVRVGRKAQQLADDLSVNELIKLMAISHYEADKKLTELVSLCLDKDHYVKNKA